MGVLISILFWCMPEKKHLCKIAAVLAAWEILIVLSLIVFFNVSIFYFLGLIFAYLPVSIINMILEKYK